MSKISSSKRLQNDIAVHEENSDRRIPSDMYYVLLVEIADEVSGNSVSNVVKGWLKNKKEHPILVAYVYRNSIGLLFSSVEDREHYLKGSHQALCSEYASLAAIEFQTKINVRIIELESRTKILVYFQTKVFENSKRSAQLLSKTTLSKKEINQLTFGEIINALEERASVKWDEISAGERFGTFYKYVARDGKEKFSTLAEPIDMQEIGKYTSYLFEG
jgi:hypothetical protein